MTPVQLFRFVLENGCRCLDTEGSLKEAGVHATR